MATVGNPANVSPRIRENQKVAENLWEKSIEKLNEEDRQHLLLFRGDKLDVLDAVLDSVSDKKQICLDKRWKYKGRGGKPKALRDLCDKVIAWVSKFKAIGDMVVKCDVSGNAALPWAGVSFLLQVAGNESHIFGRMLEAVEKISFLVTRYALVENIYFNTAGADGLASHQSDDERELLKVDVLMLYSSIMRFLAKASSYYDSNTAKRMSKSLIETVESTVNEFLDDISSKEDVISRSQRLLSQSALNVLYDQVEEVRLAVGHLRILDEPINRMAAQLADIQDGLTVANRVALLKWLSTIPHEDHHATKKSTRLEGSGMWLLRKPEFRQWESSSSSAILWLHGIPGCGKSYLLSFLVDYFSGSQDPSQKPLSGYFYCSRIISEPGRGEAASILRTILKQLCSASADEPVRDPVASTFEGRKKAAANRGREIEPLSLDDTTNQIIDVLNANQDPAFIMIDALDECDAYSVHDLLDKLEQILQQATGLVKIFVTSRDDGDIRNRLEGRANVNVDAENNSEDINKFIDTEVEKAISGRRLLGGKVVPALLKKEILETLKRKAGGMFRWVSLQLQHICNPRKFKTSGAIQDALAKLPATLKESYDTIYAQILENDDGQQRQIAERAMTILLCLQKPLSNDNFVAAVSSPFNDEELDGETIVDICCNLIICDTISFRPSVSSGIPA